MQPLRVSFRQFGNFLIHNAVPDAVKGPMQFLVNEAARDVRNLSSSAKRLVIQVTRRNEPIIEGPWANKNTAKLKNEVFDKIVEIDNQLTAAGLADFCRFHETHALSAQDREELSNEEFDPTNLSQAGKQYALTTLYKKLESTADAMNGNPAKVHGSVLQLYGIICKMENLLSCMTETENSRQFQAILNESDLKETLFGGAVSLDQALNSPGRWEGIHN